MYAFMDREKRDKILEDLMMTTQQRHAKKMRTRSAMISRRADIIEPIAKEAPKANKYSHLDAIDKVRIYVGVSMTRVSLSW